MLTFLSNELPVRIIGISINPEDSDILKYEEFKLTRVHSILKILLNILFGLVSSTENINLSSVDLRSFFFKTYWTFSSFMSPIGTSLNKI